MIYIQLIDRVIHIKSFEKMGKNKVMHNDEPRKN